MADLEGLEAVRGASFARPPELGGTASLTIDKVARMSAEQRRAYLGRIRAGICDSPPRAVVEWLEADEGDYKASIAQLPGGLTQREKLAAEHRRKAGLTDRTGSIPKSRPDPGEFDVFSPFRRSRKALVSYPWQRT